MASFTLEEAEDVRQCLSVIRSLLSGQNDDVILYRIPFWQQLDGLESSGEQFDWQESSGEQFD